MLKYSLRFFLFPTFLFQREKTILLNLLLQILESKSLLLLLKLLDWETENFTNYRIFIIYTFLEACVKLLFLQDFYKKYTKMFTLIYTVYQDYLLITLQNLLKFVGLINVLTLCFAIHFQSSLYVRTLCSLHFNKK